MDKDIKNAFEQFKRAKRLVEVEKQRVLAYLPEDAASEFHYNGIHASERYPQFRDIFEELLDH
jgi:hypothetical protein